MTIFERNENIMKRCKKIALIGAPPEEVTSLFVGLNHLTFIFDFRWRGCDAWPLVKARLAEERGQPFDKDSLDKLFPEMGIPTGTFKAADNPFSWSLFETYGAYPAVNDRHVVEFLPERFPEGQYYGKTLGIDVFSVEDIIARGDKIYGDMRAQALGKEPLDERVFLPQLAEFVLYKSLTSQTDWRRLSTANSPRRQ